MDVIMGDEGWQKISSCKEQCTSVVLITLRACFEQSVAVDYVLYGIVAAVVGILTLVGCVVFLIQMQALIWLTVRCRYETDDEEPVATRVCTTICWSTVNLFVFVSILLGMYFSVGYVELPVLVMQPYAKTNITYLYTTSSLPPAWSAVQCVALVFIFFYLTSLRRSITVYSAIQTIQTSLVIYILALLSFIGWMLMTCVDDRTLHSRLICFKRVFGGIGLVALPVDLIGDWYNRYVLAHSYRQFLTSFVRPRPIDLKQFAEKKLQLKKRCEELIQVGKETRDKFRSRPNRFKVHSKERRFTNKYKKMILDLEDELQVLNICYKRNQINPLIPWLQLFGGLGAAVITVSWWFQIIFEIFLQGLAGPYLSNIFLKGSIMFAGRFFLISVRVHAIGEGIRDLDAGASSPTERHHDELLPVQCRPHPHLLRVLHTGEVGRVPPVGDDTAALHNCIQGLRVLGVSKYKNVTACAFRSSPTSTPSKSPCGDSARRYECIASRASIGQARFVPPQKLSRHV
eukprot:768280-Hanusia_phi.AAC.6